LNRKEKSTCLAEMKKLSQDQIERIRQIVEKRTKGNIVEYKGFSKAAEELGVPKAAIIGLLIKDML